MPFKDVVKRREYQRRYDKDHKQKKLERQRRWRAVNRDRELAKRRKHYAANAEAITAKKREWVAKNPERARATWKRTRLKNRDKRQANSRRYYQDHQEELRAKRRSYYRAHREQALAYAKEYAMRDIDKMRSTYRRYHRKLRLRVLEHYGGRCQWPDGCDITDPDMLQIDHINGDGYRHRKEIKAGAHGGVSLHLWLIRNNFPPGFRILCANHNWKHRANLARAKEEGNG